MAEPRRRSGSGRWLGVLLLAVPLIAGAVLIANWLSRPTSPLASGGNQPLPTPAAVLPPEAPGRSPVASPAASPSPPAGPQAGERRRVANTDGIGVALRDGPDGQRLPGRGYGEGDVVTLLEERGRWARIRGDDGREGWVLAVTLVR